MDGHFRNAVRGALAGLVLLAASSSALAATITVDVKAYDNSTSGGTGVPTLTLTTGQVVTVTTSALDTWGAGDPPRISNADGLNGNIYAVAGDDSGAAPGTLIGVSYGDWSQNGLDAPYGSLVGQIGAGAFFLIGVSETFTAATSGVLNLFYFDSNNGDNFGQISASVSAVPIPAAGWLMLSGLAALGAFGRRRGAAAAAPRLAA